MDMVRMRDDGVVTRIDIKPAETALRLTWILAAWKPTFSRYLLRLIAEPRSRLNDLAPEAGGSHLGHAFQLAMTDGLVIEAVPFADGRSLDIGTPDDLRRAGDWV